jgi:hypothetical protein
MLLRTNVAYFVIGIVAVFVVGCFPSLGGSLDPPPINRSVSLVVNWENPLSDPTTVYVSPHVWDDPRKDADANSAGTTAWLRKLELDFGDGGGWLDVTDFYRDSIMVIQDYHTLEQTSIKHTYPAAGTYMVNARATYRDGELVYLGGHPDTPVAVTVPWPFDSP